MATTAVRPEDESCTWNTQPGNFVTSQAGKQDSDDRILATSDHLVAIKAARGMLGGSAGQGIKPSDQRLARWKKRTDSQKATL